MHSINYNAIGYVRSCFTDKFGIPRQPGLTPAAHGTVILYAPYCDVNAVRALEQCSHLWILFHFHATAAQSWQPTVRPPRLGGNERLGVFATRSNFRPNPIGLSVVKIEGIEFKDQETHILVSNLDILDGTPVLDIKPYIPYADAIDDAHCDFAAEAPQKIFSVQFSPQAQEFIEEKKALPWLRDLISQCLVYDPRPAYHTKGSRSHYAMRLYNFDIHWQIIDERNALVTEIRHLHG